MYNRKTVDNLKKNRTLEEWELIKEYATLSEDEIQALKELKYYSVDEIISELVLYRDDFGNPVTSSTNINPKTVRNQLREIETDNLSSKQQSILKSIPNSTLTSVKKDIKVAPFLTGKRGNSTQKLYSYYYLVVLTYFYKEQYNKTIDDIAKEDFNNNSFSLDELNKLFENKLGTDEYNRINRYDLEDIAKAIVNRQNKLQNIFFELIESYKKYISLGTYLYHGDNPKEFIEVLDYIRNANLFESDIVRMVTLLVEETEPKRTLEYVKELEQRHIESISNSKSNVTKN